VFVTSWSALWDAVDAQAPGTVLYAFLDNSNTGFVFDYEIEGKGRIFLGDGKRLNVIATPDALVLDATTKGKATSGAGYFFYVENADLIVAGSSQYGTIALKGGVNDATGGGAIGAGPGAVLELVNVEFTDTKAGALGGALLMSKSTSLKASGVTFTDSTATLQGAAVHLDSVAKVDFIDCNLIQNGQAQPTSAGAVSLLGTLTSPTQATFASCQFVSNKALAPGSAIVIRDYSTASFVGANFEKNVYNGNEDGAISVKGSGSNVRFIDDDVDKPTELLCERSGNSVTEIKIGNCEDDGCCELLNGAPKDTWSAHEIAVVVAILVGLVIVSGLLTYYYLKNRQARRMTPPALYTHTYSHTLYSHTLYSHTLYAYPP
jgi:hypothetical protein